MSKPDLTVDEWNAAMGFVVAAYEKEAGEVPDATAVTNAPKKRGPKRRMPVAKRAPVKPTKADEDLDNDEDMSMPDGSFFIAHEGDLKSKIDSILNAEQGASTMGPYALDVKAHIAARAAKLGRSDLVPDAWKQELSDHKVPMAVGKDAPEEIKGDVSTNTKPGNPQMAAKHSAEDRRKLASEHKALPDGSYPIEDMDDLKSAIVLAKSGHGDVAGAKALIKRRAKELHVPFMVPKGW